MFQGAHHNVIHNPQFIDLSYSGTGLEALLGKSMPNAFHDSSARYPPPRCHLDTRKDYIAKVMDWAHGDSHLGEPILWMYGPFGVGKSAVAQSCAEALEIKHKLAATLFFSRSFADRDDPQRIFTSIAYQIAIQCDAFSRIIAARIDRDPALVTKTPSRQFEELLVRPLHQIDTAARELDGLIVIIDGLDECRGTSEQCEIIGIIAASARDRTTPFRWFITSRPEAPIVRAMHSTAVFPTSFHLELPVSRKIDHEILIYLTDEFSKIREHEGLPAPWPPEEVIALLVERTAGLWIYATTIIRFIEDKNSFGPRDQLRIVYDFAIKVSAKGGSNNPLAEMDFFYVLIMEQIPLKIKSTVLKVLLIHSLHSGIFHPLRIATILHLSEEQFHRCCSYIQSVMKVEGSRGLRSMSMHFYHTSFLDFMKDPDRSNGLCMYGDFMMRYRRELLEWLHMVCTLSTGIVFLPYRSTLPYTKKSVCSV
ncbi:hypothetical protein D9756_007846 [Leucocoprinus leucothites]|uniref:Nephrocystin 3-like N-terminal domain-containing protein n=1 Tax=Leucocoprinus leucothites TaxID=201217 RepID=A0A8H5D556_9AGAR|nr:hypothetical protein D9756_007846 [Leucoagaricus leucothites]